MRKNRVLGQTPVMTTHQSIHSNTHDWQNPLNHLMPFVDNGKPEIDDLDLYEDGGLTSMPGSILRGNLDILLDAEDFRVNSAGNNNGGGTAPYSFNWQLVDKDTSIIDSFHAYTFMDVPDNNAAIDVFGANSSWTTPNFEYFLTHDPFNTPYDRYWNVLQRTGTTSHVINARCPDEAIIEDTVGLRLMAVITDIQGNGDTSMLPTVYSIDNFKPYVKRVQIEFKNTIVYDNQWDCGTCSGINFSNVDWSSNFSYSDFLFYRFEAFVWFSESMRSVTLHVPAISSSVIPISEVSVDSSFYRFEFPKITSLFDDQLQFLFSGQDFGTNNLLELQGLEQNPCVTIPTRNHTGWINNSINQGMDSVHILQLKCGQNRQVKRSPENEITIVTDSCFKDIYVNGILEIEGLSWQIVPATSSNSEDGQIIITPGGGIGPYSFIWDNGHTGNTLVGLNPGNYCITVVDAFCCEEEYCIEVFECDVHLDESDFILVHSTACGILDGSIRLSPTSDLGGTPPYSYYWEDEFGNAIPTCPRSGIGELLCDVGSGTYKLMVVDSNQCSDSLELILVYIASAPVITVAGQLASASGCDGSLEITPIPNSGLLDIEVTNTYGYYSIHEDINSLLLIDNLCAGVYTIETTDQNGCITTHVEFIGVDENPYIVKFQVYSIDGANTNLILERNLIETKYNICPDVPGSVTLSPAQISDLIANPVEVKIFTSEELVDNCTMAIPYLNFPSSYSASSNSANTEFIWGFPAGFFTGDCFAHYSQLLEFAFEGTDLNGNTLVNLRQITNNFSHCIDKSTTPDNSLAWVPNYSVGSESHPVISRGHDWWIREYDRVSLTCNASGKGSWDVGLTIPFNVQSYYPIKFEYSTGEIVIFDYPTIPRHVLEVNQEGGVILTVTDALGCSQGTSAYFWNHLQINTEEVTVDCGTNNGRIKISVPSHSANLSFVWSNGESGSTSENTFSSVTYNELAELEPGRHCVTVTYDDGMNNCSSEKCFTILPSDQLLILAELKNVSSCGDDGMNFTSSNDGYIRVRSVDHLGFPVSSSVIYTWSNGEGGASIDSLAEGVYTVTATRSGCQMLRSFTIDCCKFVEVDDERTYTYLYPTFELDYTILSTPTTANPTGGAIDLHIITGAISPGSTFVPKYDIQWIGPNGFHSSNEDVSGLVDGFQYINGITTLDPYEVKVTNGCHTKYLSIPILNCEENFNVDINVDVHEPCGGNPDGRIVISAKRRFLMSTAYNSFPDEWKYTWGGHFSVFGIPDDQWWAYGLIAARYDIAVTHSSGCEWDTIIYLNPQIGECGAIVYDQTIPVGCYQDCFDLCTMDSVRYTWPVRIEIIGDPAFPCLANIYCDYDGSFLGTVEGENIGTFLIGPSGQEGLCYGQIRCEFCEDELFAATSLENAFVPDCHVENTEQTLFECCEIPFNSANWVFEGFLFHVNEDENPNNDIEFSTPLTEGDNPCQYVYYCDPVTQEQPFYFEGQIVETAYCFDLNGTETGVCAYYIICSYETPLGVLPNDTIALEVANNCNTCTLCPEEPELLIPLFWPLQVPICDSIGILGPLGPNVNRPVRVRKTIKESQISVYPNPFKHDLTIEVENEGIKKTLNIELYDLYGKMILNSTIQTDGLNDNQEKLNLQGLDLIPGAYILVVRDNTESMFRKILIKGFFERNDNFD